MLVLFCTCCCCTGWPRDRWPRWRASGRQSVRPGGRHCPGHGLYLQG